MLEQVETVCDAELEDAPISGSSSKALATQTQANYVIELRSIDSIRVGTRFRRDLGDVAWLAECIKSFGLLEPVVITSDGVLLDGARRIAAFTLLGRTEIPVIIRAK